MKDIKKEYRYFDPNRADAYEAREAIRQAVKAGIVESPVSALAKVIRKKEKERSRLEKDIFEIHKEFGLMKECILEVLPRKTREKCLEKILLALKKTEENVVNKLVHISTS